MHSLFWGIFKTAAPKNAEKPKIEISISQLLIIRVCKMYLYIHVFENENMMTLVQKNHFIIKYLKIQDGRQFSQKILLSMKSTNMSFLLLP